MDEAFAKQQFDRVLEAVKLSASKRNGLLTGKTMDVLVEGICENDATMVSGRLSNNTMVHFTGGSELIGHIVPVRLHTAGGFYYIGDMDKTS